MLVLLEMYITAKYFIEPLHFPPRCRAVQFWIPTRWCCMHMPSCWLAKEKLLKKSVLKMSCASCALPFTALLDKCGRENKCLPTEKQIVNDCQIRSWNKGNDNSWHLLFSTTVVWWSDASGTVQCAHSKCSCKGYSCFSGTWPPPVWLLIHFSPSSKETSASSSTSLWHLLIHPCSGTSHRSLLPSKIQAQHLEGSSKNPRMVLKGTLPTAPQQNKNLSFHLS